MKKTFILLSLALVSFLYFSDISYAQDQKNVAVAEDGSRPPAGKPLEESTVSGRPRLALGFTLDLLPTALSAAAGRFGMSGQTWLGIEHVRLRLVGGQMYMPQCLIGGDGFKNHKNTVGAFIVDYVFGEHFDGWWVGTGFELWMNEIGNRHAPDQKARWDNLVWTLGGGYIWRAVDNFYIEPWAAIHVPMNNRNISLAGREFKPMPVSGEVSLKIGYFFDL